MTTNVADYIAAKRTDYWDLDHRYPWPRDWIGDDFFVSTFRAGHTNHYYIFFNDVKRQWDIGIRAFDNGRREYTVGSGTMRRENWAIYMRDNFPIPFEWCLFNLDLIGL